MVVDRLILKKGDSDFISRLTQSVEAGTELSGGKIIININGEDYTYSEHYACPYHEDVSIPELTPDFSLSMLPTELVPNVKV